jgi:hypothetical protein
VRQLFNHKVTCSVKSQRRTARRTPSTNKPARDFFAHCALTLEQAKSAVIKLRGYRALSVSSAIGSLLVG